MATTIKETLLAILQSYSDARGRVNISFENIAKRTGLNHHDLVKNLEQLQQENLVSTSWHADRIVRIVLRKGGLNEKLLAEKVPARTWADKVTAYLIAHPTGPGGWATVTPGQIKKAIGGVGQEPGVTISKLIRSGKLEARREGQKIVGLRLASLGAARPEIPAEAVPEPVVKVAVGVPATPHLDQYRAAKRMAFIAPRDNPYLSVTFTEDPIAEEALALLASVREES